MRMRSGLGIPSDIAIVFFKLMVMQKSVQALAKLSHMFCKSISE